MNKTGFIILFFSWLGCSFAEWKVDFNDEGASGVVELIDEKEKRIRISTIDTKDRGWACWWYFKLSGATPGETVTLEIGSSKTYRDRTGKSLSSDWALPTQAAYRTDQDKPHQWRQTAVGKKTNNRMVYQHPLETETTWFAWGPPFVPSDAQKLVERTAQICPHAEAFVLCKTREGRPVHGLKISQDLKFEDPKRYGVWIEARQHAWETGSSWVCQGLIEWLAGETAQARALREKAVIYLVPIMDVDNVFHGFGGKNGKPHDHNRDWSDKPHWPAVAAAQKIMLERAQKNAFDLFIDLHNPGSRDRSPFYFVPPADLLSPLGKANLKRFVRCGVESISGPLRLSKNYRATGKNYDPMWKTISKNWVMHHTSDHVVAVTLETTWNHKSSHVNGYKTVGRQQGLALEKYFRVDPRK